MSEDGIHPFKYTVEHFTMFSLGRSVKSPKVTHWQTLVLETIEIYEVVLSIQQGFFLLDILFFLFFLGHFWSLWKKQATDSWWKKGTLRMQLICSNCITVGVVMPHRKLPMSKTIPHVSMNLYSCSSENDRTEISYFHSHNHYLLSLSLSLSFIYIFEEALI